MITVPTLPEGEVIGSQVGQDAYVRQLLPYDDGFFVEAGAADGLIYSNTLLFAQAGWHGLLVEPLDHFFAECVKNRPESLVVRGVLDSVEKEVDFWERAGYISGTVAAGTDHNPRQARIKKQLKKARAVGHIVRRETCTLDSLLDVMKAPNVIDYLSLDTEGSEGRILAHFPFSRYAFKVMTIERPKADLRALLAGHGYVIVREDRDLDTFFAHSELMAGVL